jgi:hypothetical protein
MAVIGGVYTIHTMLLDPNVGRIKEHEVRRIRHLYFLSDPKCCAFLDPTYDNVSFPRRRESIYVKLEFLKRFIIMNVKM